MKTTAFIGLAGPLGYDYENEAPIAGTNDYSSPNPVLENVLGLLICYDEIKFLSPQFCPADMRDLPYVSFVSDDPSSLSLALQAINDYEETQHDAWDEHPSFDAFGAAWDEMTSRSKHELNIDNHTHAIRLGASYVVGNSMAIDKAIQDTWVAASIGLSNADVILNSPAQLAVSRQVEFELSTGQYFGEKKVDAAELLVSLRVPNVLQRTGSYHAALEEIRDRRDVREFRDFLRQHDAPMEDGKGLAAEISAQAFSLVDEIARRYMDGPGRFQSIGIPAARAAINVAQPGLGSVVAGAMSVPHRLRERSFKASSRWAPFVVSLSKGGMRNTF